MNNKGNSCVAIIRIPYVKGEFWTNSEFVIDLTSSSLLVDIRPFTIYIQVRQECDQSECFIKAENVIMLK